MDGAFHLPQIFQSGMVLQRHKPIRVWGAGPNGTRVEACLQGETAHAAIENGKWSLTFPPMEAAEDAMLTVACGADNYTYTDIAIGEVWIAAGQSNMEFQLRYDAEREAAFGDVAGPLLRYYEVPKITYETQPEDEDISAYGQWRQADRDAIGDFSAVAYYFGRKLQQALGVPVGIIGCSMGGTAAQTWMDDALLRADPLLAHFAQAYDRGVCEGALDTQQAFDAHRARHRTACTPEFLGYMDRYMLGDFTKEDVGMFQMQYGELLKPRPIDPWDQNRPGGLFGMMVRKVSGYTARGVLWYQGESDAVPECAGHYARLFALVAQSWRAAWGDELPFLLAQLTSLERGLSGPGDLFPALRAQQEIITRTVPGTHLIGTMDVGNRFDEHPKQKRPIGERLAAAALATQYGQDVPYESPGLHFVEKHGNMVTIHMTACGDGLVLRGDAIHSLEVFADGAEVPFEASANGSRIIIRAASPVDEVRYAWRGYVDINLFSRAGLPARPFRAAL